MPKRSGSNRLRSSKRSGPRSQKSQQPKSGAGRSDAPARQAQPRKPEPRPSASAHEDRDSSPPSAPARSPQKQSLLERFNELPQMTRYGIIGGVVVLVLGIAWFVLQNQGSSASAPKPAPTGEELAPPAAISVPPGMLSALPNAPKPGEFPVNLIPPSPASAPDLLPGAPPKPAPKPSAAPAPAPKPAPVETAKPAPPVPPKPAPKQGGGDNPY